MRKLWNRTKRRVISDNERGARQSVLEELFNDFNRNRFTVYKFNFIRGIFFGLGSVLGGTVVLGLLVWILHVTGHLVPGTADFVNSITHAVQSRK